jgi:hypothetical protein
VVATIVQALLKLLYVASLGPEVWLASRDLIDAHEDSTIAHIYRPLEFVMEHCEPVEHGLALYVSLWEAPSETIY